MWRYIRGFFSMIAGWFGSKADKLSENKHVMGATYDRAIGKSRERFETVKNAVAELLSVEQSKKEKLRDMGGRMEHLSKVKNGAQAKMQHRVDTLRGQGKDKENILTDAEFVRHKMAFEDANKSLNETKERFDEVEADLAEKVAKLASFKAELQRMQRDNEKLKDEKQEAIADVAIAQQEEAINATLAGIPQDTTDGDLDAARAARKRVKNRAAVTSELIGNDAKKAESEYIDAATQKQSTSELDNLLNWGDESKATETKLSPAKLPE
jgi:chromosome segregation ATPase